MISGRLFPDSRDRRSSPSSPVLTNLPPSLSLSSHLLSSTFPGLDFFLLFSSLSLFVPSTWEGGKGRDELGGRLQTVPPGPGGEKRSVLAHTPCCLNSVNRSGKRQRLFETSSGLICCYQPLRRFEVRPSEGKWLADSPLRCGESALTTQRGPGPKITLIPAAAGSCVTTFDVSLFVVTRLRHVQFFWKASTGCV